MQAGTRLDLLKTFIEFIGTDIQRERQDVNKRMFSVLLWCFVMPALLSITLILTMIKKGGGECRLERDSTS